jgi:hypothetical protein
MISSAGLRVFAALFAIGFVFVTELPAFETPCPVHDAAFARLATMGSHVHHAAAGIAHNHSIRTQGSRTNSTGDKTHQQKSHGCTCVGCGNCASSFTLAPGSLSFAPATVSAATSIPLPPIEKHACSISEHARPFSTAPPGLIG